MKTLQLRHCTQVPSFISLLTSIALVSAESPKAIAISNPGFEVQVLASGGSEQPIEAWETERPYEGSPATVEFLADGKGFVGPKVAQEESNVVLIPGTQLICQTLSEKWKPDTTYKLSAHVALAFSPGSSAMIGFAHGKAPLTIAESLEVQNVAASETFPPEDQWQKVEVTFSTGKSEAFLGEPMVIFASNRIFDAANNLLIDGFQLTSTPAGKRP